MNPLPLTILLAALPLAACTTATPTRDYFRPRKATTAPAKCEPKNESIAALYISKKCHARTTKQD